MAAVMALLAFLGVFDHQSLHRSISAVVVVMVVLANAVVKAFRAGQASAACAL